MTCRGICSRRWPGPSAACSLAAAWQAYRRAEKLLPAKPAPVTPRRIADAGAIAAEFDLVALDAWGVLNLGETAIATASAAVALAPPVGFIAGAAAALPALTDGMLALGDDAAAYDRVSGIVFLSAGAWSEARQSLLAASLAS